MSPRKPGNRDREWDRYDAPPKRPPPKRGIKVKKAGATWWGKRWIEALERMSSGYSSRLSRGKTYARAGRAHDLAIVGGKVTAKVTGSREPYDVCIELAALGDAVWSKAIAALAAKAQFAAELLAGRMPDEIDDVFKQAGKSLFPVKASDVRTDCSCPDWANPCKHVAAVHFVLCETFDRDPFLLFELRGRTKAQVLETLHAARAGGAEEGEARPPKRRRRAPAASAAAQSSAEIEVATVSLGRLKEADYDLPPVPLPSLRFGFDKSPVSGSLLRQLGAPPGWSNALTPADRLGPVVRAAAEAARRLALGQSIAADDGLADELPASAQTEQARTKVLW